MSDDSNTERDWTESLGWAFVAAFGAWAAWGWLADGVNALTLLLAVVFGLFQIATNILAVKVRELWSRGAHLTALAAGAAMIVSGLLTHESLVHAYNVALAKGYVSADPRLMSYLLLVVPYLEPLMFWISKLLTEPPQEARKGTVATVGVWGALMILLFGPGAMAAEPPKPPVEPPRASPVVRALPKAEARNLVEPNRARAMLLVRQGMKPKAVSEATGVPMSTVKKWRAKTFASAA